MFSDWLQGKMERAFQDGGYAALIAQGAQGNKSLLFDAYVTDVGDANTLNTNSRVTATYANGATKTVASGYRQLRPGDIGVIVGSKVF